MNLRLVNVAAKPRAVRVCFASLVALISVTSIARADDCVNMTTTTAEPDFAPCTVDEPQLDVDAAVAEHAAGAASNAKIEAGTPWIADSGNDVPLTLNSSGAGVSMRTSLGTWRDYQARAASKSIAVSPAFSPADLTLPKAPAAPKSPLDIWTSVDVEGYEGARDQAMRAGVGADFKIDHATTLGVSAEQGDARSANSTGPEQDSKMAAYVTLQAAPMLSLDARTEWQAGNAEFAAASGAAERSSVILAPRLNKAFSLNGGETIEPFVTYKHEFDLSSAGREANDATATTTQSAGAGVTYSKPDAYSLSVTTDVEGLGATEPQSLNSKFQLSVPIR